MEIAPPPLVCIGIYLISLAIRIAPAILMAAGVYSVALGCKVQVSGDANLHTYCTGYTMAKALSVEVTLVNTPVHRGNAQVYTSICIVCK